VSLLSRLRGVRVRTGESGPRDLEAELAACRAESTDLKRRLEASESQLKERSGLLYDVQRQYASEHFSYQEVMRDLKTERMRLVGVSADRDVMMSRFVQMKARIAFLLQRLRTYEPCADEWIDTSPVTNLHQ
jgi:hypothetical protein